MSGGTLRGATWCGVPRCLNNSKTSQDISYYRFPKDPERLAVWLQNTKRYDLSQKSPLYCYNNVRICSKHFEESMFHCTSYLNKRLKPDAIPTLCLNIPLQSSNTAPVLENRNVGVPRENRTVPQENLTPSNYKPQQRCNKRKLIVDGASPKECVGPKHMKTMETSSDTSPHPIANQRSNSTVCLNIPYQSSNVSPVIEISSVGIPRENRTVPQENLTPSNHKPQQRCNKRKLIVDSASPKECAGPKRMKTIETSFDTSHLNENHPPNFQIASQKTAKKRLPFHAVLSGNSSEPKRRKTSLPLSESTNNCEITVPQNHSVKPSDFNSTSLLNSDIYLLENESPLLHTLSGTSPTNCTPRAADSDYSSLLINDDTDVLFATPNNSHFFRVCASEKTSTPAKIFKECGTQTDLVLSTNTPRKQLLRKQTKVLKQKVRRQDEQLQYCNCDETCSKETKLLKFDKLCKELLPYPLSNIIPEQARLHQIENRHALRYSLELKKFSLSVLYMSPRAFRLLKQLMILPSERCLQAMTHKWEFKPGFNDNIFAVLKTKVAAIPDKRRICTLIADEISLKANLFYDHSRDEIIGLQDLGIGKSFRTATHALVFMITGILDSWKQPLAFFFVNTQASGYELKTITTDAINKLSKIGMKVKNVTTDMGSNFLMLFKLLGVTHIDPFFKINEEKIFATIDLSHLAKAFRNNHITNIFEFNGKKASWQHLKDFFNMDRKMSLRLAPKLTDSHINPNEFGEKMKVKLATQVYSATVSAALYAYIATGNLPKDGAPMAEICGKMDKLIDLLNSRAFQSKKKFNQPYRGKQYQVDYLFEMLKFFSNLKLTNAEGKDVTGQMKFIKGFQQTIRAVLDMHSYLKKNGFLYLFTRRLTSDPIENFFAMLRSLFGFCRSLTPIQVQRGFKKLFCINYFVKSINSNCDQDFHETLSILNKTDFDTLQNTSANSQNEPEETNEEEVDDPDAPSPLRSIDADPEKVNFTIGNREYENLKLPLQNALSYVAGYVIKKCLEVHSCETCEKYATDCEKLTKNNYFTHYKAYCNVLKTYGKLKTPAEAFLRFIKFMEDTILKKFPLYATSKPAAGLIKEISRHDYKHPCKNFKYDFLVHFYVRFRIFHILKDNNKAFKEKGNDDIVQKPETPDGTPPKPKPKRRRKRNQKLLILKHL